MILVHSVVIERSLSNIMNVILLSQFDFVFTLDSCGQEIILVTLVFEMVNQNNMPKKS